MSKLIHQNLSNKVLAACFTVHKILGPGLLESCYEGALVIELQRAGILFQRQHVYPLHYKGELVGGYIADLVVAGTIILELKSVQALHPVMEAQLLNYLRLSKCPVGYLVILQMKWFVSLFCKNNRQTSFHLQSRMSNYCYDKRGIVWWQGQSA